MAARFRPRRSTRLDFGIRNGVTRPIGLPQMIVAGGLNFGGPGTLPQGRYDTSYVVHRHGQPRARTPLGQVWRRVPALHQRELRRGHRRVQLPERGGVPGRNGERVQHHAGRAAEPHRPARDGVVRPGLSHRPRPAHARARDALRVARHAHRAGQPVRRVRCGHARRWSVSASTSTRSTGRTTGTSSRASASRGIRRRTAAPWCAPRTRGRSTNRARPRSGTRRATRRSPCR